MAGTLALLAAAIARGIAPDPVVLPSEWAAAELVIADGPAAGSKWDPALTPYAVEPLDMMASHNPATRVSVRKSGQVGFTEVGIAWLGCVMDQTPAASMVVFPTILAGQAFNGEKLHLTIEQTPALARKVLGVKRRSRQSSTKMTKRFAGGSLIITGANSAADLSSKTVRNLFADEIDRWPWDLDGQGDPMRMADARQIAFHASGDYKKLECSTPTIQGESRIDDAFEEGDQRYYFVDCPHCDGAQVLEFGGKDQAFGFKFNREFPHDAHYICKHCGCRIDHWQKREMLAGGRWVAEEPGPGRHPSYHVDALSSNLTTWDHVAAAFLEALGNPTKLKAFHNLWLARSWKEAGSAPEWQRLFAVREDYPARQVPPGGVILIGAADIQQDGIFYEVAAYGADRESWSIDAGYLEGKTDGPANPVWSALDEVYERRYLFGSGATLPADRFLVDAGYNTNAVYLWCRSRGRAMAIKGEAGWARAAISAAPTLVDVSLGGKKRRRGVKLWHVGTWPLKRELYDALRKKGLREGEAADPPGYFHFTQIHDEGYFKQLTAEYLGRREVKGRKVLEWVASGPNHFHDCKIYSMAGAAHMGVGLMSAAEWGKWERARTRPRRESDLVDRMRGEPAPEDTVVAADNDGGGEEDQAAADSETPIPAPAQAGRQTKRRRRPRSKLFD